MHYVFLLNVSMNLKKMAVNAAKSLALVGALQGCNAPAPLMQQDINRIADALKTRLVQSGIQASDKDINGAAALAHKEVCVVAPHGSPEGCMSAEGCSTMGTPEGCNGWMSAEGCNSMSAEGCMGWAPVTPSGCGSYSYGNATWQAGDGEVTWNTRPSTSSNTWKNGAGPSPEGCRAE